jgi:hypothetical protein
MEESTDVGDGMMESGAPSVLGASRRGRGVDVVRQHEGIDPVAVSVAVSAGVLGAALSATRRAAIALHPVTRMMLKPPWLPARLHPEGWLEALNREGESHTAAVRLELSRRLDELVPMVLAEVLQRARVTDLILRYVDVDTVVSAVDLDAAAARLDVAAVVEKVEVDPIVGRVDLDAVIDRVDIDAVLDKLDLTLVVLDRVDLDAVVARVDLDAVLDRVDLDAVVARVDLDAVLDRVDIDAVLDKLDLTSVVLQRVDLDLLIEAVLSRVDMVGLAAEVIDGVDLPEIIRESTGSMASDTVRGARMQSIAADEAVGRAVDRFLLRRRHRSTQAPGAPGEPTSADGSTRAEQDRATRGRS